MNSLLCPSQVPSTGAPPPRAPAAKPAPKAPSEKVLSTISRTPSGKPNLVTFFCGHKWELVHADACFLGCIWTILDVMVLWYSFHNALRWLNFARDHGIPTDAVPPPVIRILTVPLERPFELLGLKADCEADPIWPSKPVPYPICRVVSGGFMKNVEHISYSGWWFGTFFYFPYIGNNHPNWLSYFSKG